MADPIQILSLYSGSGMLDEAVAAGLDYHGLGSRILGFVEREAFAAWFLLARMEAETMERAPVFCDGLENLDARPMCGFVDLLTASPPCQPYSSAGKRLGNADQRSHGDGDGPLVHTVRIIAECRSALVFFENVPEWVTGGHFREFGEQLCRVGYDFAPPLFVAAADVGAPHERERVFILGWLADAGEAGWRINKSRWESDRRTTDRRDREELAIGNDNGRAAQRRQLRERQSDVECGERELGDAADPNRRRAKIRPRTEPKHDARSAGLAHPSGGFGVVREPSGGDGLAEGCDEALANGELHRRQSEQRRPGTNGQSVATNLGTDLGVSDGTERRCDDEPDQGRARVAGRRDDVPVFPPGRNDYRRWAALAAGGMDPALMPAVESGVPVVVDGIPVAHSDLLRLGGNAVVPQAAAVAFATLFGEWLDRSRRAPAHAER